MRTPTLFNVASQLHRGAILAILTLPMVSGLTGCDEAGPTGPSLEASVDPGRMGDQTGIPVEWLPSSPAAARATIRASGKSAQRSPDGIHYTTRRAR